MQVTKVIQTYGVIECEKQEKEIERLKKIIEWLDSVNTYQSDMYEEIVLTNEKT